MIHTHFHVRHHLLAFTNGNIQEGGNKNHRLDMYRMKNNHLILELAMHATTNI